MTPSARPRPSPLLRDTEGVAALNDVVARRSIPEMSLNDKECFANEADAAKKGLRRAYTS
jgi:hypothetical protein